MPSQAALELLVQVNDQASKELDEIGEKGGGMGDAIKGGAAIAGGAILGLGAALVGATASAAEEEKGIARLNTTLKNNGFEDAAGDVEAFIAQQEKLAFADDELRDSLNLLINQTGDLAEAQTLQTDAMNLARFGNIDLEKATRLLLKADDESYAALGKLGIQIDENATKEEALAQIRAQSAGQAEAYAATTSGSMERIQNAFGNVIEDIGSAILPLIEGPLQMFANWFQSPEVQAGIQTIATLIGTTLGEAFNILKGIFDTVGPPIIAFFTGLQTTATDSLNGVMAVVGPILEQLKAMFEERFMAVWGIIQSVWTIITGFLQEKGGQIMTDIMGWANQIGPIIQTGLQIAQDIIMSVFGFIQTFLNDHGEEIKAILGMAWDTISMLIDAAIEIINTIIIPAFQAIATFIQEHADEIQAVIDAVWLVISTIIETAMGIIQGVIDVVMGIISGDWERVWEGIKQIGQSIWDGIVTLVTGAWSIIEDALAVGLEFLKGIWDGAWNWISKTATDTWNGITKTVEDAWNGVSKFITDIGDGIKKTWDDLWTSVGNFLNDTWQGITNKFNEIWTFITELPGKALAEAQKFGQAIVDGIMGGLAGLWDQIWGFIQGILSGIWDGIVNFFGGGGDQQAPPTTAPTSTRGVGSRGAVGIGGGMGMQPALVIGTVNVYADTNTNGRRIADEMIEELEYRLGDRIAIRNGTRAR